MESKGQNYAPARGCQKSAEGHPRGKCKGECFAPIWNPLFGTCNTALIDSGQRGAKHSPFSMHDDDGDAAANNDGGDGDGGDDGGIGVAFF